MNLKELKQELLKASEITKIPHSEFGIGAGGAMLFYGLRDHAADVDVAVSPEVFESLRGVHPIETFKSVLDDGIHEKVSVGLVDIHNSANTKGLLQPKHAMLDGFKVERLHSILAQKVLMNRAKDQEDIRKLNEAINKQA